MAILDAAWACFAREGLHRTTMAAIAADAGLTAGALYRYFDSKDALVIAFATREVEAITEQLDRIIAAEDPGQALIGFIRESFQAEGGREHRSSHILALELWAEIGRDTALARKLRPVHRRTMAKLEQLASVLEHRRSSARHDPAALARVLRSLHLGLLVQLVLEPKFDADAYAGASVSIIERGILEP